MYSPLPDDWEALIRSGAERKALADVFADPSTGHVTIGDIEIEEFSVTIDRRSDIRRTASVKIQNFDLLQELKSGTSSLQPYGSEVRIRTGFHRADGTDALITAGLFQIEELDWDQDEESFTVTLNDRSKGLARTNFGTTLDASGKNIFTFINDLVFDSLPWAQLVIDDDVLDLTLPGGTSYRGGKLAAIKAATESIGAEFFFDADGIARVSLIPAIDPLLGPGGEDWSVDTGENGVLVSYARKLSRKDTYNKIHVYGAPPKDKEPQPYAFAVDDDPSSPTYYNGRFGKADLSIERQELTSSGQCKEYAASYLKNSIGLSKSIDLRELGNPAIDAGDIVLVTFVDGSQEFHLVDTSRFDQTGGQDISTRVQQGDL